MRFASLLLTALIVATPASSIQAAESGETVLRQLEAASTDGEYNVAVMAVNELLESGQLDQVYADRIANSLAVIVADDAVLNPYVSIRVSQALRDSEWPLPAPAFTSLMSALEHRAVANREVALKVLGGLPADDPRRSQAIDAMSSLVINHDHESTRSSAGAALSELGRRAPLPDSAIAALVDAAVTDEFVTVRIDAADALSYQSLSPEQAKSVSESLVQELIKPTETTRRALGINIYKGAPGRARELLARMYEPPYPAHVIDLWISQTHSADFRDALAVLREAVSRNELTAVQQDALLAMAQSAVTYDQRAGIYDTAFSNTAAAELARAVATLNSQSEPAQRLAAAHRIHSYYQAAGVPADIADSAAARIATETDEDVFRVMALLLIDAADGDRYDQALVDGLLAQSDKGKAYNDIVPLLSFNQLEQLILQAATDSNQPSAFRYLIFHELAQRSSETGNLSPELTETLDAVARSGDDYLASQAAGHALAAWGGDKPLVTKFANRRNQIKILGYTFLALGVVNAIACIASFIAILAMPLQRKDGGSTAGKRAGLFLGWLLLSFVVLVLVAIAFVGFLGHNSPPPPDIALKLNFPLYIATSIYVLLTWLVVRRARQKQGATGQGTFSPEP